MKRISEQELTKLNRRLSLALRRSRRKRGVSVGAVADALNIKADDLLEMENRPINVPLCDLSRIIRAYGFPCEVLLAIGTFPSFQR